ncbi:MAG: tyrosine-protein phosphatase [Phycisphaerales bacterium]|nr:tyrosine-protein phosphatase [Phycisphaerales bacterium]
MNVPRFLRRIFRLPYDGLRHFGVVDEGVLYRSGQPRPDEVSELIRRHGLRTVVSLRGARDADDPDSWESAERAACEAGGAQFVTIPCNHKNPPTAEQVEQFLSIVRDPARRPVLVHCRLGQQRTLLFCALYRVHVQGMDPTEAEKEMDELGFNVRHYRHQRLLGAFREFCRARAARASS